MCSDSVIGYRLLSGNRNMVLEGEVSGMKKYNVYIPYGTYTEHIIEAGSPEQAREIAFDMGNLDKELLENLEVQDEYVEVKPKP